MTAIGVAKRTCSTSAQRASSGATNDSLNEASVGIDDELLLLLLLLLLLRVTMSTCV